MTKLGAHVEEDLKFTFSAHLLEDLGVNLYTSLSKALVEFVANSYDAEARCTRVRFDTTAIDLAAQKCFKQFELDAIEAEKAKSKVKTAPLEKRTLEPNITIVLEDDGHGMSREELESKFLVIGRRRRENEPSAKSKTGKRLLMGRKGLGKLAGFGIAHRVQVESRASDEKYTTVVTLDYDDLINSSGNSLKEQSVTVPTRILTSGGLKKSGTRITLSRLVYQTLHTVVENDIVSALGRHFGMINSKDFKILVNSTKVKAPSKKYAYAWPEDSKRSHEQLVNDAFDDKETRNKYAFSYRLRFTEEKKYLMAMERGVRVYAHNRLASLPSMLDVNTNAHGFRYSDYLDGVVIADFLDELPTDLIATDRSDLRWETPPLAGLVQGNLGNPANASRTVLLEPLRHFSRLGRPTFENTVNERTRRCGAP